MSFGLTPTQKTVFDHLVAHFREHGSAPSVRELGRRCGHKNPSHTHRYLREFETRGHIRRIPGKPGAIEFLNAPSLMRGPIITSIALSKVPTDTLVTELMRRGYSVAAVGAA